jgi:3-phenylpropionate/trans-cinnamate dioxygenase ferredoxin reductase component
VDGRVVIVGAGLGGLRAAEQVRAAGHAGPVTVVGAEPHLPYNRPPLSKELLADPAELSEAELHAKVEFRRRASLADVTFRLGRPVASADLNAGSLQLADGPGGIDGEQVAFDGLVIATGLRPRRVVPVIGGNGAAGARPVTKVLRDLGDCRDLRGALRARPGSGPGPRGRDALGGNPGGRGDGEPADDVNDRRDGAPRVVIVGGGFVGCEVACTALRLGCAVTVVEAFAAPMIRVLGAELATAIQRSHEAAGIRFLTGMPVAGVTVGDAGPAVELGDGELLPADVVLEATGSLPNVEWLAGNGLDLSDGVLCDNAMAVIGQPGAGWQGRVVAVGDVARFPNPMFDDVPRRVEHWSMPADTAKRAALTLAGTEAAAAPFRPLPSFWTDQLDLRLWSYGAPGLADEARITDGDPGDLTAGLIATYHRAGRHVGTVTVNIAPRRHHELRTALLADQP